MRLVEIRISNFRGISGGLENNKVKFEDNIIFLIGQNNCGKSSVLKAYQFFHNAKQVATQKDFFNYDVSNPIVIEADFVVEEGDEEDNNFRNEPDWVDNWVQRESGLVTIKKEWTAIDQTFQKFTKNSEGEYVTGGFGGLHQKMSKYTPTPILINAIQTEKELEDKVNKIIEKHFLKTLQDNHPEEYRNAMDSISELQNLLNDNQEISNINERINLNFQKTFPDLELYVSPKESGTIDVISSFKKNHSIDVKKRGVDRKETFEQHGHGIIRQALFNFFTFYNEIAETTRKEFILLFEEPELYLHPKSERLLREALYDLSQNSPFQIMCTTHSPQMIDLSKPHTSMVRIEKDFETERTMFWQAGHTLFQGEYLREFVRMIESFDPNVCEVFYSTNVIVVEGYTEALVTREILKKDFESKNIFVLNAGTKNNIPFFLEILNHFRLSYHVIHDSDTRYVYNEKERETVRFNNDGTPRLNSAWSFNQQIWDKIIVGRESGMTVGRSVSIYDFETSNEYEVSRELGKPLSAYRFINQHNIENLNIYQTVRNIVLSTVAPDQDQDWLEENVNEPIEDPIQD